MCVENNTVVRRDRAQNIEQLLAAERVEGARRLIANEQLRLTQKRLRYAEPLLHAAGKPADALARVGKSHQLKQLCTAAHTLCS